MDFATQMRRTYLSAVPHTVYTAAVWLTSGYLADSFSKAMAIVFFIAGCTFIFPFGELIRKVMKPINFLSAENKLPRLFTLLAFTIPLSYPLIYMACVANINYFFPAFTILVGAHYLPFVYGYGKLSFGILCGLLVIVGTTGAVLFQNAFSFCAYATGGILIVFAAIHYYQIKKELA